MITAQLLGGASLRAGDLPLAGPPAQRHRIALLTLVVSSWPQALTRDRAMALLWPDRDLANARRLLNLAVHVLRSAVGEDSIVSTADALLFNPGALRCDLHELRSAIAAGENERVLRLYTGVLLEGFHLADSPEFSHWLDDRRNELAHAYVNALGDVARQQEAAGDIGSWITSARRLLAADPYAGTSVIMLMRALDAASDRAGAIQVAAEHTQRLRDDLELPPDDAVVAFAEQLRRASVTRTTASPTTAAPAIAVLPFLNFNPSEEYEYFADGMTEDVIAHLATLRAIKVISLTSVLPFRQRTQTLAEIGDLLRATALLDGSVRFANGRVRIVAKLVDVKQDALLWAATYDRELTDIFAIQTDVALNIAGALRAELSGAERTRVQKEPTRDLHAYRAFLRGRQLLVGYTPEAMNAALQFFYRAVERDPSFALAWANIAIATAELAEGGQLAPDSAHAHAAEAAAQALRHDPELGLAHCADGFVKMVVRHDWKGAEQAFRRALELSPNSADVYDYFGRFYTSAGRLDEAIQLLERAHELDPLAHRSDAASAMLRAGRYQDAIGQLEALLQLDPTEQRGRATLAWAYFLSGRREQGIAELEAVVAATPTNTLWLSQLAEAYGLAGRRQDALAIVQELEQRARTGFVSPYHFAYAFTGLDAERALDWLERAMSERSGAIHGIGSSFLFTPLRAHPRFRELLRQLRPR